MHGWINKSDRFDKILCKCQCKFREGYITHQYLIAMIEEMGQILGNGGTSAALLIGFSKTFDCLPHDLLIAKLNTYEIEENDLKLLFSYLRKQKTKSLFK